MATETLEALASDPLIALYFETESPEERDVLFEVLAQRDDPSVLAFLAAMLAHDDDPFMRVAAASALALRGHAEARAFLTETLQQSFDDGLFESAVAALVGLPDPAQSYALLAAIWQDAARDGLDRRVAMVGMEQLDSARALAAFRAALAARDAVPNLPLDLLGGCAAALVRSGTEADKDAVRALQASAQRASFEDPADRDAILDLCAEALALFEAPPFSDEPLGVPPA
jgi:hypothetical protein